MTDRVQGSQAGWKEHVPGGGGGECCSPTYIVRQAFQGEPVPNLGQQVGILDFAATLCGEDGPITAEFRPAFDPLQAPAPLVVSVDYGTDGIVSVLRVTYDSTGSGDGEYVLEVTNACGCCTLIPFTIQSG